MHRDRRDAFSATYQEIEVMTKRGYSRRNRSFARATAVALFVASTGYVAGSVVHGRFAKVDASAAFAQPIQAAQPEPTSGGFSSPNTEWTRSMVQSVEAPRECDATRGLTTECIFMD